MWVKNFSLAVPKSIQAMSGSMRSNDSTSGFQLVNKVIIVISFENCIFTKFHSCKSL